MPNSTPGHSPLAGKSLVNETEFAGKFKAKSSSGGGVKEGDGPKLVLALACIAIAAVLGMWQYGLFGGKDVPGAGVVDPEAQAAIEENNKKTPPPAPSQPGMVMPKEQPQPMGGTFVAPGAPTAPGAPGR